MAKPFNFSARCSLFFAAPFQSSLNVNTLYEIQIGLWWNAISEHAPNYGQRLNRNCALSAAGIEFRELLFKTIEWQCLNNAWNQGCYTRPMLCSVQLPRLLLVLLAVDVVHGQQNERRAEVNFTGRHDIWFQWCIFQKWCGSPFALHARHLSPLLHNESKRAAHLSYYFNWIEMVFHQMKNGFFLSCALGSRKLKQMCVCEVIEMR